MKRLSNPVIDYRSKAEREKEPTLLFSPCLNCNKDILDGYYGRWGQGGVCSKTCNEAQMNKRFNP